MTAAKKLLLHVGGHKTGSTAIQMALMQARPQLGGMAIAYPDLRKAMFGGPESNHNKLARALAKPGLFNKFLLKRARRAIDDQSKTADLTIISSEAIVRHTLGAPDTHDNIAWTKAHNQYLSSLAAYLDGFDVSVLCYFRQPEDIAISMFKEQVVRGRPAARQTFANFLEGKFVHYDYPARMASLERTFNDVTYRSFDDARKTGLVEGFLNGFCDAKIAGAKQSHVRISPSNKATLWLQAYINSDPLPMYRTRVLFALRDTEYLTDAEATTLWPDRDCLANFMESFAGSYEIPFIRQPDLNALPTKATLLEHEKTDADAAFIKWKAENAALLARRKALGLPFFAPDP